MRSDSDTAPRFLLLWEGTYEGRVDELVPGFFIAGRDRSCHLIVDDDSISGRHASLEVSGGGLLELVDLSSAAGTYVNGGRVTRCALRVGDRVNLGPGGELCFVIRENQPVVAASSHEPHRATAWVAPPAPAGPALAGIASAGPAPLATADAKASPLAAEAANPPSAAGPAPPRSPLVGPLCEHCAAPLTQASARCEFCGSAKAAPRPLAGAATRFRFDLALLFGLVWLLYLPVAGVLWAQVFRHLRVNKILTFQKEEIAAALAVASSLFIFPAVALVKRRIFFAPAAATPHAGAGTFVPRPWTSGSTTGPRGNLLKVLGALAVLGVIGVVGISAFAWYVLHKIDDDRVVFDSPPAASSTGTLTDDGVERAVRDFMSGFTKGGEIEVDGVRELPNENAATADLRFVNWVCTTTAEGGLSKQSPPPVTRDQFGMPSTVFGPRLRTYNVRGQAVLKHYTDGRWMLTEVRVGSGFNTVTVSGSVVVR